MARGIHTSPVRGLTNEWVSPLEIVRPLGPFDLDPCVPYYMPWETAARSFTDFEDGLWQPWRGRVWLNPPYGDELHRWIAKLSEHGNGIALVPSRTEVEKWFWPYIWEAADAILFLRGRLYFHRPSGSTAGNAGHGSVLVAYGANNVEAIKASGIVGRLIENNPVKEPPMTLEAQLARAAESAVDRCDSTVTMDSDQRRACKAIILETLTTQLTAAHATNAKLAGELEDIKAHARIAALEAQIAQQEGK